MMKHRDHILDEVEKTMQSLDGLKSAETDPFFYSRLSSKLEHRNEPQYKPKTSLNFAFAFSTVVLLLLISFNLMFISSNQQIRQVENTSSEQTQWLEDLTYDYQAFNVEYYTELEMTEE